MLQIIDILKYDSESGTTAVYLKKKSVNTSRRKY